MNTIIPVTEDLMVFVWVMVGQAEQGLLQGLHPLTILVGLRDLLMGGSLARINSSLRLGGRRGAVGEYLGQPRVIGDHHPVMLPDDVRDGGEPGVIGHSKHRSEVTFLPHNSLQSF